VTYETHRASENGKGTRDDPLGPVGADYNQKLRRLVQDQVSTFTDKAVKSDDARVPVHLWNLKVLEGCNWTQERFNESPKFWKKCFNSFNTPGSWLLGVWKRRVERSFYT